MKRNRRSLILFTLLLAVSITACSWPQKLVGLFVDDYSPSEGWQDEVDRLVDITRNRDFPPELLDPTLKSDTTIFDANHLLLYMDHLNLREGYALDFVYVLEETGGYPIVYIRGEEESPFGDYAAYQAACDLADPPETCDYLNFVEGDGTEEGYFQFVLMSMMGDQFYLYGDVQENEVAVVADTIHIGLLADSVLSTKNGTLAERKIARQIRKVDPAPIVTIEDEQVTVEVTWFTPASGLYRTVYVMTPDFPYQIVSVETEQLLAFRIEAAP